MGTTWLMLKKMSIQHVCGPVVVSMTTQSSVRENTFGWLRKRCGFLRLVCTYLQDYFSLRCLYLQVMSCQGREIWFRDQSDTEVLYEEQQSDIAFRDWIDQIVTKAQLVRYP